MMMVILPPNFCFPISTQS